MNIQEQIDLVRRTMQTQSYSVDFSDNGYREVAMPLYTLLAEIIQPEDEGVLVYGEIDHVSASVTTGLLVTKDAIYHARIDTSEDEYRLNIGPRSSITSITVENAHTDSFSGTLSGADFTVQLQDFSFSIPVRAKYRDHEKELSLLKNLHKDLMRTD